LSKVELEFHQKTRAFQSVQWKWEHVRPGPLPGALGVEQSLEGV